ncbi:hypothetical protein Ancab_014594 [Ancistrocladus abbreviatus]
MGRSPNLTAVIRRAPHQKAENREDHCVGSGTAHRYRTYFLEEEDRLQKLQKKLKLKMGYVMVVSLPLILLILIIALAAYLLGRARGRSAGVRTQYFAPTAPPFQAHPTTEGKPSQV